MPSNEKEKKPSKKRKKIDLGEFTPATNSQLTPRAEKKPKSIFAEKKKEMTSLLRDIGKLPEMSDDELKKLLMAIALGLVPDQFGLEASIDTKLKAISLLQNQTKIIESSKTNNDVDEDTSFMDDLKETLMNRKIEGVDK